MFVLFAIMLSAIILIVLYHTSQTREASFQRKYELVSELRNLVTLCRQHRSASHYLLNYGNPRTHEITIIEEKIKETSEQIIARAHFDNKPIYRVLKSKLNKMMQEWENMTISQNQMAHGRSIRHCMFLIDEIILGWLIESRQNELGDEYNLNWQQISDSLESLTQFRIAIEEANRHDGLSQLRRNSALMMRRLNQLSVISPLAISSPACSLLCKQLEDISNSEESLFTREQLYKMSTDASLIIFNSYDNLLTDVAESIYAPLPKLALSI